MPNCARICSQPHPNLKVITLNYKCRKGMFEFLLRSSVGMCGTLTAVYDSAVGGLREQRMVITILFLSLSHTHTHTHTHIERETDLQLQHQCVAETKKEPKTSLQLESPDSSEEREKERR